MAKKSYIGVTEQAHKVKKIYVGVEGVARKVKSAYVGVNGIAKKVFSASPADMTVTYTGNYTDEIVTMGDGLRYRLLTLTSSGTLTLEEACNVDVWLCDGGDAGKHGAYDAPSGQDGGDGGKFGQYNNLNITSVPVTIGAGGRYSGDSGGFSHFNYNMTWIAGATGGEGAQFGGITHVGDGAEGSTRPFLDSYFTNYPCAGGGGGARLRSNPITTYAYGGNGGWSEGSGAGYKSKGGITGGGDGAYTPSTNDRILAKSATYYGSGGGGSDTLGGETNYGAGYQGVVFVRIPLNQ